jgi:hypothetical protein
LGLSPSGYAQHRASEGGSGLGGRGCLFWLLVSVVLSVGLTVVANLVLNAF